MSNEHTETKRDRVRRLLIAPLVDGGMCSPKGVDGATEQARLNRICDEVAHLSDVQLGRLRLWCEVNGDGVAKRFWPPFVSIAQIVNAIDPKPIEERPELASWFGSVEGPKVASVDGLLVSHFRFIERNRRPPVLPGEGGKLARHAAALWAEVERAREMRECGRMHDEDLLAWFDRDEARALRLVERGKAKREQEDAG